MSTDYYPKKHIKFQDILDNEEILKKEHGLTIHREEKEYVSGDRKGQKYMSYFFVDSQERNGLCIYPDMSNSGTTFCRYGLNDVSHIISTLEWVFDTPIFDEYSLPESYWEVE